MQRDVIPLTSPSAGVLLPPYARRLDVRATRAAFAAGTLGTVGDDAASQHAQGVVVAGDANGDYPHDVEHVRQSRLARWQEQRWR